MADQEQDQDETGRNVARASAWMALGTIVSRITGFVRLLMIAVAIGTSLDADLFNNANTIPNAMYILVAGGVFNVVLVPQLVRAMQRDDDGGDAYAQRIMSLALAVLVGATLLLTALVPLIMHVVFTEKLFVPRFAEQQHDAQVLMWLCMPQVFFYGAFVLVGQVLNARGRFGPMMWAPIVNNVAAVAMLGSYIAVYGSSNGKDGFTTGQILLLGVGSTAGIVLQTLVLLPFLRATGFRFRLRFDLRGVGLGHTLRLGVWTLLFILANQVAFIVVQRLGTSGTVAGARTGEDASGSAVYEIGFLVSQMPHGVITVSLATAVIPSLSAWCHRGEYDRVRLELGRTLRVALVVIVPLAVAVGTLGHEAADLLGAFGDLAGSTSVIGRTIAAFSLAMVTFTIHYVMLRGFYADEDTRTPFWIQLVIAATNIVVAVVLVGRADPSHVAAALALAYGLAYTVGSILSVTLLSRRLGRVVDAEMVRFVVRLALVAAVTVLTILGVRWLLDQQLAGGATASLVVLLVAGGAGAATYVVLATLVRLRELPYLVSSLRRR